MAQDLSGFVQDQILDIALPTLKELVPAFQVFSTSIGKDPILADGAGEIPVALVADPSAQEHTGDYTANSEVSGDSVVKVNPVQYHPVANFRLTEEERTKLSMGVKDLVVANRIRGAVLNVGHYALSKILANVTKANFSNEKVITSPNFDGTALGQLRTLVTKTLKFGQNRSILVPADYFETLVGDPTMAAYFAQREAGAITEGVVRRVKTFDLVEYNQIPTNSQSLAGIAADPRCMAVAVHPVQIPERYGNLYSMNEIVRDEASGLSMTISSFLNASTRTEYFTVEMYVGAKAGRGDALVRIVTAANP